MVHLGRLKPPRKAAGQMDLLTVPSGDGADMRSRQDVHVVTTLTSHVTTVNNALGPTSTLSNPNLYSQLRALTNCCINKRKQGFLAKK